jgi:hypothetical protein
MGGQTVRGIYHRAIKRKRDCGAAWPDRLQTPPKNLQAN